MGNRVLMDSWWTWSMEHQLCRWLIRNWN